MSFRKDRAPLNHPSQTIQDSLQAAIGKTIDQSQMKRFLEKEEKFTVLLDPSVRELLIEAPIQRVIIEVSQTIGLIETVSSEVGVKISMISADQTDHLVIDQLMNLRITMTIDLQQLQKEIVKSMKMHQVKVHRMLPGQIGVPSEEDPIIC